MVKSALNGVEIENWKTCWPFFSSGEIYSGERKRRVFWWRCRSLHSVITTTRKLFFFFFIFIIILMREGPYAFIYVSLTCAIDGGEISDITVKNGRRQSCRSFVEVSARRLVIRLLCSACPWFIPGLYFFFFFNNNI